MFFQVWHTGKNETVTLKQPIEVKKTTPTCSWQTVQSVIVIFFDAKVLMFCLNFTQFQIVSSEITFLAEELMIFLLRNLSPRVFFW